MKTLLFLTMFMAGMVAEAQDKALFCQLVNDHYESVDINAHIWYDSATMYVDVDIEYISRFGGSTIQEIRQYLKTLDNMNTSAMEFIGAAEYFLIRINELGFKYLIVRIKDGDIYYTADKYDIVKRKLLRDRQPELE